MTTAAQMCAMEETQVGVTEGGGKDGHSGNIVPYWDEIGEHYNQGQSWCGAFQNAMAKRVGLKVPLLVSTREGANSFRKDGRFFKTGEVGDFVFFDWYGKGIDHIGLVVRVNEDGTYTTIEGNTSAGNAGSQRNGGMVAKRIRRDHIAGFGRPLYTKTSKTPPVVTRKANPFNHADDLVRWTQWALGIKVDGKVGSQTKQALAQFRFRNGIDPKKSYPDPQTIAALSRVMH